jgi:hypothetical protein
LQGALSGDPTSEGAPFFFGMKRGIRTGIAPAKARKDTKPKDKMS